MANTFSANKAINGTFGRLWVNDEERANIKSFEAKVTLSWEDVPIADDLGTHKKYMGHAGEGTATFTKFDSYFLKLYAAGIKSGNIPEVSLVAKLSDPASYGAERVKFTEVTFDELTLSKFESKTITEEEIPFKFADYELLDQIGGKTEE